MEIELKPCPFCNAPGVMAYEAGKHFVRCSAESAHRGATGCYNAAPGNNGDSGKCDVCWLRRDPCQNAIAAWNLRTPSRTEAEVVAEIVAKAENRNHISDTDAVEIWRAIEILSDGDGDAVTVLCANPDFNSQPNYAIVCNGHWTNWEDRRFAHDNQAECFRMAVRAIESGSYRKQESEDGN